MRFLLCVFFVLAGQLVWAQQKPGSITDSLPSAVNDSVREVHLIRSDLLRFEKRDSTELQILTGNAELRQENTFFSGDSIVLNKRDNVLEVFGNIHINDSDSINVDSQYLIYYGNTRIAYLKKNVKLTDGKATLTTDELEYNLNTKRGNYKTGGKIVTSTTTLTSREGFYYADTKDAFFKRNVRLKDPEYTMTTDSLQYNVDMQLATFIAPTTINDGKSIIKTSDGYYDMKNAYAYFGRRPTIEDNTQYITADQIVFDKNTGLGRAQGNFVYIDTLQGITLHADNSDFNRDTKVVLATGRPLMIIKQESDSIYVTGDSLYSGVRADTIYAVDSTRMIPDSLNEQVVIQPPADTTKNPAPVAQSPVKEKIRKDRLPNLDTSVKDLADSLHMKTLVETIPQLEQSADSVQARTIDRIDSVRFFQAFHHVRIFSDSMQSICDSMYFSGRDSVFRLFQNPIVWAKDSQLTGDTIYLYTKNKKPHHIEVLENAFSISRSNDSFYNQLKGNTINGFFKEGDIEHVVAKGSAESLYYLQDDDSAYTGANYAEADLITLYFQKKAIDKITWEFQVKGGFYPVSEVPDDKRRFRNFRWEEAKRPKSREELLE